MLKTSGIDFYRAYNICRVFGHSVIEYTNNGATVKVTPDGVYFGSHKTLQVFENINGRCMQESVWRVKIDKT